MTKPRFYYPTPLKPQSRVPLPDDVAHYALRVLRLEDKADITLFDGHGGEYQAQLLRDGKRALALVGTHDPREAELAGDIRLIQGLPSGDKMDWVVEKAVELGASCIVPVAAERSVVQLRGERLEKRLQHWQRIAQSASEQCGRNRIMHVAGLITLKHYLEKQFERDTRDPESDITDPEVDTTATLLCHPDYGIPLHDALYDFSMASRSSSRPVLNLLIGPEGGWSDQELRAAEQYGVKAVRFGSRVLRTETAGLALIAACTALLGWID